MYQASLATLAALTFLPAAGFAAGQTDTASQEAVNRMARQIQREIVTLPEFGVFDEIRFSIKGSTVTLKGQASRPILKSSAEKVTKKVEGVDKVINEIEVLPLSGHDDDIRAGVYVAIYGHTTLSRYNPNRGSPLFSSLARRVGGITNDPPPGYHPIHILVKNGHVTLKGVVDNPSDSAIAEIQANSVPGVFSVTNDLNIANETMRQMTKKK